MIITAKPCFLPAGIQVVVKWRLDPFLLLFNVRDCVVVMLLKIILVFILDNHYYKKVIYFKRGRHEGFGEIQDEVETALMWSCCR